MPITTKKFGRAALLSTRVLIAGAVGGAAYLLAARLELVMRILVAYNLAISIYLTFIVILVSRADANDTRELAQNEEASNSAILALAVIFSALSLAGVGLLLDQSKEWSRLMTNIHMGLSTLAIFLSWILVHVFFGFHYARLYYGKIEVEGGPKCRAGLVFPDDEPPDYWDFLYYSFTIAMCYQTPDVAIRSRRMRRVTLVHALLSFLFVSSVLGLVVNVISNLV